MTIQCPAKINLTLAVLGRRADGYHDLESWVVPIALHDELELNHAEKFRLIVEGDVGNVPKGEQNLVTRATQAFGNVLGRTMNVHIRLTKRIPAGTGLGGGSSDAAATLRGLNVLHQCPLNDHKLRELAAALGSDVPFFLDPRPAILRGRGEWIEPLKTCWNGWVALVCPCYGLSTRAVYARHASLSRISSLTNRQPWRDDVANADRLSLQLFNDLLPAATDCEPRLRTLMDSLTQTGGRAVHLTGSGSGCFTVFDEQTEAMRWVEECRKIMEDRDKYFVIHTMMGPPG